MTLTWHDGYLSCDKIAVTDGKCFYEIASAYTDGYILSFYHPDPSVVLYVQGDHAVYGQNVRPIKHVWPKRFETLADAMHAAEAHANQERK